MPASLTVDDALRARLQEAHAIWLASMWQDWQVPPLLCGDDAATCRLFTPDGALLSYDGAHLTRDGARYAGTRLGTAPALAAWR